MNHHHHHHRPTPSFHFPAHDEDSQEHARAKLYLSSWLKQSSFRVAAVDNIISSRRSSSRSSSSSGSFDNGDKNISDTESDNDIKSNSDDGSISSVSLSIDSQQDGDIGRLSIGDDVEVYENDDDFNAGRHTQTKEPSHARAATFYSPVSYQPRQAGGGRGNARDNDGGGSTNNYLPSDLANVIERQQQQHGGQFRPNNLSMYSSKTRAGSVSGSNVVSQMPWRDLRGKLGKYTGHVNDSVQPHGSGALIYKDGTAQTSIWKNGHSVECWTPETVTQKEKELQTAPIEKIVISHSTSTSKKLPKSSLGTNDTGATNNMTHLPHLDLGDIGSLRDMLLQEKKTQPLSNPPSNIDSLQIHDFAFILRSDGHSWTYAIIADRQEDTLRFVVDTKGATKILSRRCWPTMVRLVNPDACSRNKKKKKKK